MSKTLILYGATGYTGQLIAQTAIAQGLQPVLAGRTASKIAPLAHQWDKCIKRLPVRPCC